MAKHRSRTRSAGSGGLSSALVVTLIVGVIAGFVGGFLVAKERYTDRITEISKMNMEKAVTIDTLNQEIQVLGAQTEAKKK